MQHDLEPIIRVENLSKTYEGAVAVHALKSCNLTIPAGEFWAIIGPSGSGKSTLLHLLGLLDTPTTGELWIRGEHVSSLTQRRRNLLRAHAIGFVFQQFHLVDHLTAVENVELKLAAAGIPRSKRRHRAHEALARFGLADKAASLPSQLSGGEQQRVAIARAVVTEPALVLCDEPTGNLDSTTTKSVLDDLKTLHRQGQTIVVATHDPLISEAAETVVRLEDGRITS